VPPGGEVLNFDLCDFEKYVKSKTRVCDAVLLDTPPIKIGQFSYNRWLLNGKSLIFKMAAWRPQNRSNRENQKKAMCVLPKGIRTPSFIEIALAVTKCALFVWR
jgi:hypothetical protein